jgi:(R,R)-butanediol dehydrogenase / meso-butanediol dehydrogenase / diacetyl reductase
MKAAVWHDQKDVRIEDLPLPPSPPEGQVQIEVKWCGICGTDLHEYLGGPMYIPADKPHPLTGAKSPVILGHEMSGKVIAVGAGVRRVSVGDRVVLCPIIGCRECEFCRSELMGLCPNIAFLGISWHSGGFSQVVNVFDYMCYKLPSEVSYEEGALIEPLAAAVRAMQKARLLGGETLAVIGAGAIGLMATQAALQSGAGQVIVLEPSGIRRQLATECGASACINPLTDDPIQAVFELTAGKGADAVIECSGNPATGLLAGRVARRQGRVVVMGVFEKPAVFDYTDMVYGEKSMIGSMGGYGVFDETIGLLADKQFNLAPLSTKRIGLAQLIDEGFKELSTNKEKHIKIIVAP